ncbi:MAG: hypothetical protein R6U89_03225 [Dehalococcoidia bacterium]
MRKFICILAGILILLLQVACSESEVGSEVEILPRESKIPADAVKMTPQMDKLPPQIHSDEWEEPVPVPGPINTAGGEDSPFVMPDGDTLYFWFTPDVSVPVGEQLTDGVTSLYVSERVNGQWQEPERLVLQDPGKLAMDGCPFVQDGVIWFCSAREGYTGVHWFKAEYSGGEWTNWQNADFDPEYDVGELHITADGSALYFHSQRPGGKGDNDIWVSRNVDGEWQPPKNVEAVNSEANDSRPFVSEDGSELWFTRTYQGSPAVFRSLKSDGHWQEPELIISQFAGEPTVDNAGNIYFAHHFIEGGQMIEADIYVARKK